MIKQQYTGLFLLCLITTSYALQLEKNLQTAFLSLPQEQQEMLSSLVQINQKQVIAEVDNLLKKLIGESKYELTIFQEQWQIKLKRYLKSIEQSEELLITQQNKCKTIKQRIEIIEEQISIFKKQITRYESTITINEQRIVEMQKQICLENGLFIDNLIEAFNAIELFQLIRKVVLNFKQESLAQLGQVELVKTFVQNLNLYSKNNVQAFESVLSAIQLKHNHEQSLLQKKANPFDEPVVSEEDQFYNQIRDQKHVDNKKGQISLQDYTKDAGDVLKGQFSLIKIIDELIANQEEKIESMRKLSVETISKLIFLMKRYKREITQIRILIKQTTIKITKLQRKITILEKEQLDCPVLIAKFKKQLKITQQLKEEASLHYNARIIKIYNYIKLFTTLYQYYETKVMKVATKADVFRFQDYYTNKNFKASADYTYKRTSVYYPIKGRIQKTNLKEADDEFAPIE